MPRFPEGSGGWTIDSGELSIAIARTIYSTDEESTRYAMGGIYLELDGEKTGGRLVATDGRRMAHCDVSASPYGDPKPYGVVLPIRACKALADLCKAEGKGGWVDVSYIPTEGGNFWNGFLAFRFQGTGNELTTRPVEGRFPRYRDVFVKDYRSVAMVDPAEMLEQVKALVPVATAADEDYHECQMEIIGPRLHLVVATDEGEQFRAILPCHSDGPDRTVRMNALYLAEMLKALGKSEGWIAVKVKDAKSPVEIVAGPLAYVIMPINPDPSKSKPKATPKRVAKVEPVAPVEVAAPPVEILAEVPAPVQEVPSDPPTLRPASEADSQAREYARSQCGRAVALLNSLRKARFMATIESSADR